jgi:hypothetical protein
MPVPATHPEIAVTVLEAIDNIRGVGIAAVFGRFIAEIGICGCDSYKR